jgi:hypothetical protein
MTQRLRLQAHDKDLGGGLLVRHLLPSVAAERLQRSTFSPASCRMAAAMGL